MKAHEIDAARRAQLPPKARKVASTRSTAVVWIYENANGQPAAIAFDGRKHKPVWRYRFTSFDRRRESIERYFAACEKREATKAERKARGRGLQVGDVLNTCWGYEQTNREWFEVTALIGSTMVELRQIAAEVEYTAWEQGKTVPMVGQYIGSPMRKVAREGRVNIDSVRLATLVEPLARIGGKAVYGGAHFTSYA